MSILRRFESIYFGSASLLSGSASPPLAPTNLPLGFTSLPIRSRILPLRSSSLPLRSTILSFSSICVENGIAKGAMRRAPRALLMTCTRPNISPWATDLGWSVSFKIYDPAKRRT